MHTSLLRVAHFSLPYGLVVLPACAATVDPSTRAVRAAMHHRIRAASPSRVRAVPFASRFAAAPIRCGNERRVFIS